MTKKTSCPDHCQRLLTVPTINFTFARGETTDKRIITACFYSCWYESFVLSAKMMYSSYSANYINEMADISFTDTLLAFMQKAAAEGFYQHTATAKSIAFGFFKRKLHETIRKDKSGIPLEEADISDRPHPVALPDADQKNNLLDCLEKIKAGLSAEDIDICNWKFKEGLSHSEIATRLKITTKSFTNRFYRLSGRMENLMNDCLKSLNK